jgi:hypothetical protein
MWDQNVPALPPSPGLAECILSEDPSYLESTYLQLEGAARAPMAGQTPEAEAEADKMICQSLQERSSPRLEDFYVSGWGEGVGNETPSGGTPAPVHAYIRQT